MDVLLASMVEISQKNGFSKTHLFLLGSLKCPFLTQLPYIHFCKKETNTYLLLKW